ncbi:MAG TPA: glycolate oxidase subunit GlcF [Steroidobacteraceae bacterium]|nr:glycolate oxidase subunit GlcF [Steroidobacteraceae bacterium]
MQTCFSPEQLKDPETAASEQILRRCVHCGFCTATCPTYVLLGDELDSPRGRIYLIKEMLEGGRPATAALVKHVDRCLSCLACMTTCPSGVNYQHLVDHARVHIERTFRRAWPERMLRLGLAQLLPYPHRLRVALALARLVDAIVRRLPERARRWPAPLSALLALAREARPAERAPAAIARGERRGRVALLAGCVQSIMAPAVQSASQRLLLRAGFDVVGVEGCCGALVHHLGRAEQGRALAARILARLEAERLRGLDAIVVNASGCGTHLKDYGFLFRNDRELAGPAAWASSVARDITEVLAEPTPGGDGEPVLPDSPAHGVRVAYHSACSLQHGQRVEHAPRRLLERAGFVVVEVPEGHLCCGSAGTYNILQPQIAAALRARKLAHIRRTDARVVAAGNLGCIVQLASAEGPAVVHTVELLDWAQGGPDPLKPRGRNG